jgi:hypothetical protein
LGFILNDNINIQFYITGNLGIGKMYFSQLILVEFFKWGSKVLIDYKGFVALIDLSNSKNLIINIENDDEFGEFADKKDVWNIINEVSPKVSHDFKGEKIILVSSSKKNTVEDFFKHQMLKQFNMLTWDWLEVNECWKCLYRSECTLESLKNKFSLCDEVIRWIFDPSMSLAHIKKTIKIVVTSINWILNYQG